jgi:hypothetical protein
MSIQHVRSQSGKVRQTIADIERDIARLDAEGRRVVLEAMRDLLAGKWTGADVPARCAEWGLARHAELVAEVAS